MKHKIEFEVEEVESSLPYGLRIMWASGSRGKGVRKETVELTCGAGVGSPWVIFTKTRGGKTVKTFVLNAAKIIKVLDAMP